MAVWFRQFCIRVSDIDASLRFYESLGFTCFSRIQVNKDLVEVVLENADKGGWLQLAQDRTISTPINLGDAVFKIYVYTDNCQASHDALVQAGYEAEAAPYTLGNWPYTVAFFKDPDGYLVELVENNGHSSGRDCGI